MGTAIAVVTVCLCLWAFIIRRKWFCAWLAVLTIILLCVKVPV